MQTQYRDICQDFKETNSLYTLMLYTDAIAQNRIGIDTCFTKGYKAGRQDLVNNIDRGLVWLSSRPEEYSIGYLVGHSDERHSLKHRFQ
jgi:hypothetical protein